MLFKTTEEHEALRMQVREFVETEVKPIAAILDKENKFYKFFLITTIKIKRRLFLPSFWEIIIYIH